MNGDDGILRETNDQNGRVEQILAQYLDRLNSGESIDPLEVFDAHPDLGEDVLREIYTFMDVGEVEHDPPLGTLGDYTLRRQIGRGGMGVVYEAWEGSMDRVVALKVLPAGVAADTQASTRFMREAQAAGKLSHQNVVAVYSMGVTQQTPYYAMEYVEGETLAQVLGSLKEAEPETDLPFGATTDQELYLRLAKAFADVADGLQHAHSKGVTHRDIKPSNLILDSEGRLRILDFGLAILEGQESLTLSGDFVGTPAYMSPEQAKRRKIPVDHRTDIYSLGATLYELLTHQQPFRGEDHADTLSQIIERDPRPPRQLNGRVPQDLETIVLKCLRKDAGDRYATAEALGQDLRRFVRGDPIEARSEHPWEAWKRSVRRHRVGISTTLLTAIVFATAVVTAIVQYQTRQTEITRDYEKGVDHSWLSLQLPSLAQDHEKARNGLRSQFLSFVGLTDFRGTLVAAAQTRERLRALQRSRPSRPEAFYVEARAHLLLGGVDAAARAAQAALATDSEFFPARLLLEEIDDESDGNPGAIMLPAWAVAWRDARAAKRRGDRKEEGDLLSKVIATAETADEFFVGMIVEATLARGQALLAIRHPLALADFEVVRRQFPQALEPVLLKAKTLHVLGRSEEADELFSTFHERTKFKEDTALWVVQTYRQLRDLDRATAWIDRVKDRSLALRLRAGLLISGGQFSEARSLAEAAIATGPRNPRNHECLLSVLDRAFSKEQEQALNRALGLVPDDLSVRSWIPLVRFRQQRYDEGAQAARTLLEEEPQAWVVRELLACNLFRLGKPKEALAEFQRILEEHSECDQIRLGWALFCLGRLREAGEAHEQALRLIPDDSWTLRLLAMSHDRLGEDELARGFYESSLLGYPRGSAPHVSYGNFLKHRGQPTLANEQYVAARTFNRKHPPHASGSLGTTKSTSISTATRDTSHIDHALENEGGFRINCGGGPHVDAKGRAWAADSFFRGGRLRATFELSWLHGTTLHTASQSWKKSADAFRFHGPIDGTAEDYLYQTNRWFHPDMADAGYHVPLPPGVYRVTLHFAETWYQASELRSFDVAVERKNLRVELDIFAERGFAAAFSQSDRASVSDGALDIRFSSSRAPPMVAAIEIETTN